MALSTCDVEYVATLHVYVVHQTKKNAWEFEYNLKANKHTCQQRIRYCNFKELDVSWKNKYIDLHYHCIQEYMKKKSNKLV